MGRVKYRDLAESERQLATLLKRCTVPVAKCDLSRPSNIRWLRRNLTPLNCPSSQHGAIIRLLIEVGRGL